LLGGGQEFPSAGTYPIDEHVILVAVAGPTTVVTETSRRGLMRLLSVRIQDFRCIEDSTEFPITDVTCLVGKNESGKTALLKALYKLKPDVESKAQFEPANDYPKRKWRPDQPIPANPPAVTTKWKLDAADVAVLEKQFGAGTIADHSFYDNEGLC